MSFLDNLFGAMTPQASVETRSIETVTPVQRSTDEIGALLAAGTFSGSGVPINYNTALQVSAAHACARLLAQGLAQPSCDILLTDDKGGKEVAKDHSLSLLLSYSPNPDQTAYEFREQLGLHYALSGNAFVRKVYSGNKIVALWPIDPKNVTVNYNLDGTVTYNVVGVGNNLTRKDIWHIRGLSWKGYQGENVIGLAREALGLSIATEAYGSSLFKNGARPAGIVSLEGNPGKDALNFAASQWNAQYAGVGNANKTAFIGKAVASYTPIAATANEAQWTESRKYQIEEICRAFGVRPSMVYTTGATSYASVEQEFLAHVKFTLAPLHTNFEQSAQLALLTPAEYKKGYRIKVNTSALLRGSATERMNIIKTMVTMGLMTANEARAIEDMPAFDFPEADLPKQAANIFGDTTSTPTDGAPTNDNNNEGNN